MPSNPHLQVMLDQAAARAAAAWPPGRDRCPLRCCGPGTAPRSLPQGRAGLRDRAGGLRRRNPLRRRARRARRTEGKTACRMTASSTSTCSWWVPVSPGSASPTTCHIASRASASPSLSRARPSAAPGRSTGTRGSGRTATCTRSGTAQALGQGRTGHRRADPRLPAGSHRREQPRPVHPLPAARHRGQLVLRHAPVDRRGHPPGHR